MSINISLTIAGEKAIVKLSDFGLAKLAKRSAATAIFTTLAGTPGFLAPEVFREEPYTFPVDVFSLALLFLAMIQHEKGSDQLCPHFGESQIRMSMWTIIMLNYSKLL